MRRQLLTLTLAGLFGALLLASDASACCHKKNRCAQPCPPVPCATVVVAPCPAPAPAPCAPTGCCNKPRKRLFGGLCHRKKACAAPVVCMTPVYAPVMPSVQSLPSGQAY